MHFFLDDLKSELNHKNVGEILRDLKLKFADNNVSGFC